MGKKEFNDIMLDIVGWIMVVVSTIKIVYLEITQDPTIPQLLPYIFIAAVGIILVAFTIKKVGARALDALSNFIKKKTD